MHKTLDIAATLDPDDETVSCRKCSVSATVEGNVVSLSKGERCIWAHIYLRDGDISGKLSRSCPIVELLIKLARSKDKNVIVKL